MVKNPKDLSPLDISVIPEDPEELSFSPSKAKKVVFEEKSKDEESPSPQKDPEP